MALIYRHMFVVNSYLLQLFSWFSRSEFFVSEKRVQLQIRLSRNLESRKIEILRKKSGSRHIRMWTGQLKVNIHEIDVLWINLQFLSRNYNIVHAVNCNSDVRKHKNCSRAGYKEVQSRCTWHYISNQLSCKKTKTCWFEQETLV